MKRLWISLAISLFSAVSPLLTLAVPETNGRIPKLDMLTNDELINSVQLGSQSDLIREVQNKEATRLLTKTYTPANGCNVEVYRGGEVIIVTVPASLLFPPNGTELMAGSEEWLAPLKRYANTSRPDFYRVLLVMHADSTGSTAYTDALTLDRVESIFDALEDLELDTRYVFPTAAGATDPLMPEDTYAGRAQNRRLEIFLIPGEGMLKAAKSGRVAF